MIAYVQNVHLTGYACSRQLSTSLCMDEKLVDELGGQCDTLKARSSKRRIEVEEMCSPVHDDVTAVTQWTLTCMQISWNDDQKGQPAHMRIYCRLRTGLRLKNT